jgi:hypothetical protein
MTIKPSMSSNYDIVAGSKSSFLFESAAIMKKVTLPGTGIAGKVIFKLFPPGINSADTIRLVKRPPVGVYLFPFLLNPYVYA